MRVSCSIGDWRRDERGVAAIEFALTLPFFALLGLGAADTAILVHHSHQVEQGLELGGTYLSKAEDPDSVLTQSRQLAVTGQFTGGTSRVRGWDTSNVTITFRTESGTYRNGARIARLSSSHDYDGGLGFLEAVLQRDLKVQASYEARLG